MAHVLPTVWLKALMVLFDSTVGGDAAEDDDAVLSKVGPVNDCIDGFGEFNGTGMSSSITPFRVFLLPLVLPYVCDLLVSMAVLMEKGLVPDDSLETTLSDFFASVPWMYFVNYQRSIILSVGTGSKRFLKVASPLFPTTSVTANETDCFSVGNTDNTAPAGSQGLLPNDSDQEMLRAPVSSRGVLEGLELSFLQLKGMTSLIQKNVVEPLKGDLKQCTAFRREVLSMCHSLCGIMCTASAALLEYSSVNGQLSTYEGSSTLEVALCLLEESLHVFDRLFFNVVSPLSNKEDPFMIAMPEEESELGLLAALWESASGFTKFMSRHPTGQKDLFARIAKSIFALVSYMFSSGWRKTDLCEEALNGWLRTVASAAASSATLAVQRDSLRVFVDFLNSTEIPPHVREGVREKNQLKQQLVPHVWHLLGICNEGMQADVVELLLRLYTDEEARRALDVITTEETMECGERLVILFSRMAEVDAPQNYFLPGLYMLLRALAHQNSSLRWLAQSTIRQFIPYFHRLLNPLLISLTRQLVCFSTQAESSNGTEGQSEMASTVYSAQELHDYEVNQLDPVGFVHVVRCILSNPATLPQLFSRLCSLPAPEYMESHPPLLSLTGTNARSSESEGAGDEVNADSTVLGSAFAALVHVLLGIAYQNLSPRFSKGVSETVSHGGELGVAAVEALTMVLQASRSLPEFTKNVLHTWSVTSVKVVELLHEVVRCRLFPPEQIAMLQHLLDSVRLLSSVDPPKGCASPSSGGDSSCQCTAALKMDLFYEAVEVGVERAATRALLPHGWSDRDLLSVWCDTLVGLIPHLYEQREEGSTRILRTLIRVIEQQVRTASSLKDCTVFRVVQVCLNGIYCVLEYCFVRERECAIRGCSSAKVGGGSTWFGARVGIFGGNSSLREQKLLEPVVECTEMMWDCMRCIVATLFKVHCCARRVLEQATRSGAGSVLGRGDSRPLPSGSAEVAAAAQVEESICRVLCLYKESVAKEFFRVFIEVWASRYAPQLGEVVERSMRDNGLPNTPGASLNATGEGVRPNDGKASLLSIISTEFTPRDLSSPLWEQESVVQLLNTGAATDALALINGVKEILADAQVASSAVVPHCELFGSGLTLDTAVLYFIHVFLRVSAVPSDDIPRVQAAVANFFYAHLAARTVTVTGLSFMLLCLSHFPGVRGDGGALDSSISTLGAGKDKRGSSVLCKVLDALSSIGCITSVSSKVDPNALYFALSTVGYALPRTVPVLQPEHDRITSSAVSLFRRSVFPVVAFGIDAQIDEDAHSRTPLVQTALEVAVEVLGISEINSRRLRQELLDGPCSWDFFRLPRRSLHRYRLLFTRLSQDSTFHAEIVQHFTPSPTQSNRFGGLVSQSVSEEQQRLQRAVQVRRLAFYVASMPALPLMADRELCLLLRDQIAEALRLSSRGASSVRCTHGNVLAREAMFLFRVLLTKFEPVLLQPFWPLVLPEMVCALTEATSEPSETTEGGSGKDGSKMDGEKVELLSFQLECLKVLHFALVIMPEVVAPFCWVFVDDLGVVNGHCLAGDAPHPFVPIVQRRAAGGVSPAPIMQDLQDATVTGAHITGRWMGKQQPLLRLPSILNGGPQGVQACAAALVLFSRIRSIICSANHTAEEQQQLMPCLRLLDGWDEEYLNYLLDVDFSCIHEGVDAL
uniref:WGS project CAEQ00000000 data, annotated contig 1355 n=1 Tax=Trypanosoma congolense (strain IL3000) TaxID=1068625 RepID=F9W5P7_TRYCI|nr:unnamed protein product [Trypanosoma congolense IL3000]